MTNSHLRNAIAISSLAVLTAVVFVGAGSVLGIGEPTQSPELGNNISPTFNGLDVQGDIVNTTDGGPGFNLPVVINDNVTITKNLNAKWGMSVDDGDVFVGGNGLFGGTGHLVIAGNIDIGSVAGIDLPAGSNYLSAAGTVKGNKLESKTDTKVGGNLDVLGTVSGQFLKATQTLELPGNGKIINGDDRAIVETGWSGTFGDFTSVNSGYDWAGNEPTSVVSGENGVFFYKGLNGSPYQSQLAKIDLNGKITANAFGTYFRVVSNPTTVNAGAPSSISVSCPVGSYIMSCGATAYPFPEVYFYEIDNIFGVCWASAKNTGGVNRTYQATAVCQNPAI